MNTNEDLQARLLAQANCESPPVDDLLREAAAALARPEEGRGAVATVVSFTNGSYHRNYRLTWHRDVPTGTQLFVHADSGKDEEVFTHSQSECDTCGGMVACPRCDVEHLAPHSGGEGDAATLMEGWHSAINDADEIFANADTSKRDAIRNRASRVVNWLKAHPPVATPTPQAAGVSEEMVTAVIRRYLELEPGEKEIGGVTPESTETRRFVRELLEAAFGTAAGAAPEGQYRLLTTQDLIEKGDTVLADDAVTWLPLSGWEVGMPWHHGLMPVRRKVAAAPQPGAQHGQEGRDG